MASVGVRELRQHASELLRRVEQGETIEITDRGRRVDRLRALGDIEPAKANLDDLPAPLVLARGVDRPSDVLERLRRDER